MEVHLIKILILDHDRLGASEAGHVLETSRYPNRCIRPHVLETESVDIGEWSDDNPLNMADTFKAEVERLFNPATQEGSPPVPAILHCPHCRQQHIDQPPWDTRPHRTHKCQNAGCGMTWRVSEPTCVGVAGDGRWISMKDRKPEFDAARTYLVTDGVCHYMGQYHGDAGWFHEYGMDDRITHWQPLPELP